ncbi:hypothetical protein CsSME_00044320 [Camellia sinensis var. sinensis]
MSCVLLTGSCHHRMTSVATTNTCLTLGGSYTGHRCFRYDYSPRCCWNGDEKRKKSKFTPASMTMGQQFLCRNLSRPNFCLEVLSLRLYEVEHGFTGLNVEKGDIKVDFQE